MLMRPSLLTLCLGTAALSAQTTRIVDAQAGPGSQFLDLPPAVAASAPGDIILVRYVDPSITTYTGAVITRALTIIGVGGQPGIAGLMRVEMLPVNEHVVLRNLRIGPFQGPSGPIGLGPFSLRNNSGSVHLQEISRVAITTFSLLHPWSIENCRLVTLTACTLPVIVANSLLMTNTDRVIFARSTSPFGSGSPNVRLQGSTLRLVDSVVSGSAFPIGLGTPAIGMCNSRLQLTGATTVTAGGSPSIIGLFMGACSAPDEVAVGPGVTVTGTQYVNLTFAVAPALSALVTANQQLAVDVLGDPQGLTLLAFGPPAANPLPLLGELLWLDPIAATPWGATTLDALGRASWQVTLPAGLATGISTWLQAIVVNPAGSLALTNPGLAVVP